MNDVDYARDCIHLQACRRMNAFFKSRTGLYIKRGCTKEYCTAYQSKEAFIRDNISNEGEYVDTDEAIYYARVGASSIERGYGPYDVYCSSDLNGKTAREIALNHLGK